MVKPRDIFELELPSRKIKLGQRTLIMGVLNVTPDSFHDGGRFFSLKRAVDRGLQMEDEGADFIDVGGESTRPPHLRVLHAAEEMKRVIPVIERLSQRLAIPLSIDTYKSEVAQAALFAGAEMVNDVGGFRLDSNLPDVVGRSGAAVILMHSRGTPTTMHQLATVRNILRVLKDGLRRSIERAIDSGIKRNHIILDPGLGFGKRAEDNLLILRKLGSIAEFRLPLLVGASRKSFLGRVLNLPVSERLLGSLASVAIAILNGAQIVRVHDVKETVQVARICDAVLNS